MIPTMAYQFLGDGHCCQASILGDPEVVVMGDIKRQPWWIRKGTLTAGEATLLGVAIGWSAAIVSAFSPPRDFSYTFLWLLLLSLGLFGGIVGYTLWLSMGPVQERWRRMITTIVVVPVILGLLVVVSIFWRDVERLMGVGVIAMMIGLGSFLIQILVIIGLGIVHLGGYLAVSVRRFNKSGTTSEANGVWDRELDQA
jgi:hypothetical protein